MTGSLRELATELKMYSFDFAGVNLGKKVTIGSRVDQVVDLYGFNRGNEWKLVYTRPNSDSIVKVESTTTDSILGKDKEPKYIERIRERGEVPAYWQKHPEKNPNNKINESMKTVADLIMDEVSKTESTLDGIDAELDDDDFNDTDALLEREHYEGYIEGLMFAYKLVNKGQVTEAIKQQSPEDILVQSYKAQVEELKDLTPEQKAKVLKFLTPARIDEYIEMAADNSVAALDGSAHTALSHALDTVTNGARNSTRK